MNNNNEEGRNVFFCWRKKKERKKEEDHYTHSPTLPPISYPILPSFLFCPSSGRAQICYMLRNK